ncbi:MAG: methyltransferase domain-containing protein [Planctomycetota bacterium]
MNDTPEAADAPEAADPTPAGEAKRQSAEVYEADQTIEDWADHYYQPLAVRYYDKAVPAMLTRMGVQPDQLVLDAGCGTGVHSLRTAKFGARVEAMDISHNMLKNAKALIEKEGYADRVSFSHQDLTALTYNDAQFDHAFNWGVIIHVEQFAKGLDELVRVVKPGGSIALYVTNKTALDHKAERLARLLLRKPGVPMTQTEFGPGATWPMNDAEIYTMRADAKAISTYLAQTHGVALTFRGLGEFTEAQWRVKGPARTALQHVNRLAYTYGLPASMSATQVLVYKKPA